MQQDEFKAMLAAEHFDEVVTIEREPNGSMDNHSHQFEVKALILDGELRISTGAHERVYGPGDILHLQANVVHSERYGPQGAKYLVGRK